MVDVSLLLCAAPLIHPRLRIEDRIGRSERVASFFFRVCDHTDGRLALNLAPFARTAERSDRVRQPVGILCVSSSRSICLGSSRAETVPAQGLSTIYIPK